MWGFVELDAWDLLALSQSEDSNRFFYIQKLGRKQTASHQDKWLLTETVKTLKSCKHFLVARNCIFCLEVIVFGDNYQTCFRKCSAWCLWRFCRFLLSRFTLRPQESLINSFWQDWRKKLLQLRDNNGNTWNVGRLLRSSTTVKGSFK